MTLTFVCVLPGSQHQRKQSMFPTSRRWSTVLFSRQDNDDMRTTSMLHLQPAIISCLVFPFLLRANHIMTWSSSDKWQSKNEFQWLKCRNTMVTLRGQICLYISFMSISKKLRVKVPTKLNHVMPIDLNIESSKIH